MTIAALAQAGMQIGGSLFGPGSHMKNPSRGVNPYFNEAKQTGQQYLNPYIQGGKNAYGKLPGLYEGMLNPNDLIGKIGAGYQKSPGYDWQLNQGESAINNAASAGGMLGTPQHQQQAGQLAGNLANQDFWHYLQEALGLYGKGVGGIQGISDQGFQGSEDLAGLLASILGNQAQYKYAGNAAMNAGEAKQGENLFGGLGGLVSGIGNLFGGK